MPKDAQQWWTEDLAAAIVGRPGGKLCKSLLLPTCQRPAKPRTAVRFRSRPPLRKKKSALLALFLCRKCGRSTPELSGARYARPFGRVVRPARKAANPLNCIAFYCCPNLVQMAPTARATATTTQVMNVPNDEEQPNDLMLPPKRQLGRPVCSNGKP